MPAVIVPPPTTPLRRAARLGLWCLPLIVAWLLDLPVCLYAIVLDSPCPGCGITRAAESLARLDLEGAMRMNPIAPAVVPIAAWLGLEGAVDYVARGRTRLGEPLRTKVGVAVCLALAVVWLARRMFGAFGGPVSV